MFASNIGMKQGRRMKGFTLIELMIVVTILGVLAAVAMPSYSSFVAGQRIKSASFDLMSLLTLARSEAIKRNTNVTLNFDPALNAFTVKAGVVTLRQQEMFSGITINCVDAATHAVKSCPADGVVYTSSGRLALPFDLLEITSASNNQVRCIRIDMSGRPNSKKEEC